MEQAVVVVPELVARTPAPGPTVDEDFEDRGTILFVLAVDVTPPTRVPAAKVEEALAGNLLPTARSGR